MSDNFTISEILSRLKSEGKLVGTIAAAKQRHKNRKAIDRFPATVTRKPKALIPLDFDLSREAEQKARSEMPRIRNWETAEPSSDRGGMTWDREQEGTYPGRKKYVFYVNRVLVTSFGYAFGSRLYARINTETYKCVAPRGYVFGTDNLGIYITAKREGRREYRLHLCSDHIQEYSKARIRSSWLRHSKAQLARKPFMQERVRLKVNALLISNDFHVTAEDSRAAGNCIAGTLAWGKKHGLTEGVKYPAKMIVKLVGTHPAVIDVLYKAAERTINKRKKRWVAMPKT